MQKKILLWLEKFLQKKGIDGVRSLGNHLGSLMWTALPGRSRLAVASIQKHLDVSKAEALKIAKASFCHNARSFLEIAFIPLMDENFLRDRLIVDNPALWNMMLEEAYPAVATTAHLGSWELLAGLFGLYFPAKPSRIIVVRKNRNEQLNERIFALRGSQGATILSHRNVTQKVLHALKEGGMASFLVDHNCSSREAVFLPFFNEVAAVNMGPAMLAVRAKVPTFSIFLVREEEKYRLCVEPWQMPNDFSGTIHERIVQTAKAYTATVEKYIRRYPEQWFWMHNRWKTRPES